MKTPRFLSTSRTRTLLATALLALSTLAGGCAVSQASTASGGVPSQPEEAFVSPLPAATLRNVDVAALHEALGRDQAVLIDVRTPGEFAQGHMPGARNIPLDSLESSLDELRTAGGEIYLACRSGSRSNAAGNLLVRNGLSSFNVRGGMNAWQAAGYSVE